MSEPNLPQNVTVLYSGVRLGAELLALLGEERRVNVINSAAELAKGGPPADVIVVDVPAQERRAACEQVRRYHRGPLVVLIDRGDSGNDPPPDRSRTLLTRPFSMRELAVALAASASTPSAPDPAGRLRLLLPHGSQDRRTGPDHDRGHSAVGQAVPRLKRRWRDRQLARISITSIMAALLFMGAFALVNQSDPCGPSCDELIGADLTSPSSTTVGGLGAGPYAADPGVGVVASTTTEPSVKPTADEGSGSDEATSSPIRIPTTTWSSGAPTPTSSKTTSRPLPSAPSTIAPTTTKPRAPTTTATTTPTPTTAAQTTTTEP